MIKLFHLFKSEIIRLIKYKIFFFGLLVSIIWAVIIALADVQSVVGLVPYLVLMDTGMMSIILLAASFYYEKQEGTMQSMLVTPVRLSTILLIKVAAMVFMGIVSFVVVVGTALVFHDFDIRILPFLGACMLAVLAHTAIGYVLTLHSKDFLSLLVKYMGVALLFFAPTLLVALGVFSGDWELLGLLSPTYAAQKLFAMALGEIDQATLWISVTYLALIPALLYPLVILKRYEIVAMEG